MPVTKGEARRLKALANRWNREADKLWRKIKRDYARAGASPDDVPGGTGDEGWMQVHRDGGLASGLELAAHELRTLLADLCQ